jgi:hypothetical protein
MHTRKCGKKQAVFEVILKDLLFWGCRALAGTRAKVLFLGVGGGVVSYGMGGGSYYSSLGCVVLK